MCIGAADALFVHLLASELGIVSASQPPRILTDASAAMAENNQLPMKCKHLQVRYLHTQTLVRTKRIVIGEVGMQDNIADLLTNSVNKDTT